MPADPDNPLAVIGETFGSLLARALLYLCAIAGGFSIGGSLAHGQIVSTGEVFKLLSALDSGVFFLSNGAPFIHPFVIVFLFIYLRYEGSHLILMIPLASYTWLGYAFTQIVRQGTALMGMVFPFSA